MNFPPIFLSIHIFILLLQQNYIRSIKTRTSIMKRFTIIISFIMLTFMPLMAQVKQTVAVLGDSYSTFEGFIPKGYATWYSPTAPPETTDVNKVEQTWWWQVISVKRSATNIRFLSLLFMILTRKRSPYYQGNEKYC